MRRKGLVVPVTSASSTENVVVSSSSPSRLMGWSIRESATTAAVATVILRNGDADASGVVLDGVSGTNVSTPDSPDLSVTGDIDIRCCVAMNDWTPTGLQAFVGKFPGAANRSFILRINTTGTLRFGWSEDGSAFIDPKNSTVAPTVTNGEALWLRVTLDVDNGASGNDVVFYTSDDPKNTDPDDVTWVQLGSTVTTANTTSIFDGNAAVEIGAIQGGTANLLAGTVYYAEVRDGIDGTIVASPDFIGVDSDFNPGATASGTGTDDQGNVWTLNGAATVNGSPDQVVASIELAANQSNTRWLGPDGVLCTQGIVAERVTGESTIVAYVS